MNSGDRGSRGSECQSASPPHGEQRSQYVINDICF